MTQEQKRIKIAEACGWTDIKDSPYEDQDRKIYSMGFPPGRQTYCFIPDYFSDLNAMHEAEEVLVSDFLKDNYHDTLCDILIGGSSFAFTGNFFVLHATAAQRAEAFGRTLNLW